MRVFCNVERAFTKSKSKHESFGDWSFCLHIYQRYTDLSKYPVGSQLMNICDQTPHSPKDLTPCSEVTIQSWDGVSARHLLPNCGYYSRLRDCLSERANEPTMAHSQTHQGLGARCISCINSISAPVQIPCQDTEDRPFEAQRLCWTSSFSILGYGTVKAVP